MGTPLAQVKIRRAGGDDASLVKLFRRPGSELRLV